MCVQISFSLQYLAMVIYTNTSLYDSEQWNVMTINDEINPGNASFSSQMLEICKG